MKKYDETSFITGLRFFAVMMVFLAHSNVTNLYNEFSILEPLYHLGKYGVDVFFVISGFTIVYQLNQNNLSVCRFVYIRLARISSAYWPLLLLVGLYYSFESTPSITGWYDLVSDVPLFQTLIFHFFYLGSLVPKYANSLVGVEWSLNIEVFYYMVFALLCYFNLLSRLVWFVFVLFIALILSISSAYFRHDLGLSSEYYLWGPMKYFYMFVLGGLSFSVRKYLCNADNKIKLYLSDFSILLFFLAITIAACFELYLKSSFVMSLVVSMLTFITLSCVNQKSSLSSVLNNRLTNFIGGISFSIYLLHYPILNVMQPFYDGFSSLLNVVAIFVIVIVCSYGWFFLFENKFYTYLKKLNYGR